MTGLKNKLIICCLVLYCFITTHGQDYSIVQLPFNSSYYDEFSPVYFEDGLVFCSNRKGEIFLNFTDDRSDKPLFNIFYVEQGGKTNWGKVTLLSKNLNTSFNEGPATFNDRQNAVYFSRNLNVNKRIGNIIDRKNYLGIYYSKRDREGNWSTPSAFQYNNPEYNLAHPTLSEDGSYLFFSSDMPGGFGGSDLYVCEWKNGGWGEPVNLGSRVNTLQNEAFPFIHSSGRLYFSSDKPGGVGRLDIYYSEKVNNEWITPIPMEPPINSRFDDYGFIIDAFKKNGFFSSDRQRSDDIYSFNALYPMFENTKRMELNNYCYVFFEEGAQNPDSLNFMYEWDLGDGTKIRGNEVEHCYNEPGEYTVLLNVIDRLTGEVYFNEAAYQVPVEDIEQVYINCPDSVVVGQEIEFDGKRTNLKNFDIRSYHWDMGDGRRTRGISTTHVYTAPGEYIVQLGVTSKTDKQGNSEKMGVFKNIVVLPGKNDRGRRE
ncbi:MAG: PKD domain-containing protein [Bacteroidales bacterium]